MFARAVEKGRPPDVFIAGDNAQAKAGVEALIESLGEHGVVRPGNFRCRIPLE
jgi:predicted dinucleotide-binding enzyme